MAIEDNKRTFI